MNPNGKVVLVKRLVGIVCAALVAGLLALNGSAPAAARIEAAAFTPTLSTWRSCGSTLQCSTLTVPLNYAAPDNGQTVRLAISRLKAVPGAGAYAGIVVGNPGGPGASGLGMPFVRGDVPGTAAQRYDWIGFDPRGVGSSSPSLHCNPKYFGANRPSFVPTTSSKTRYWKKRTANYAKACGASAAKALLPFMTTRDSARDLESLRVALRAAAPPQQQSKLDVLNYYGFSYGTYLGAVYATLYPNRVGRFVLDGVVDPARYWYRANLDQSSGFDKNLNRFFSWVAKHDRTYRLGKKTSTIRKNYNALLKKLDKKPAAGGKLGPDELADGLLGVAYDRSDWPGAAAAYAKLARKRQGYSMYARYRSSNVGYENENGYAVYLGVQCTDQDSPGWTQFAKDTKRVHKKRPYIAWNNTWYNMPCRTWPAPARGKVHVTGAAVTAKILLVNETYDAATPFSGALTLRSLFPSARLIEGVGGTTHSASLRGIGCLDNRIAAYLDPDNGAVPARLSGRRADVRCSPYPKPSAGRVASYKSAVPRSAASTIR